MQLPNSLSRLSSAVASAGSGAWTRSLPLWVSVALVVLLAWQAIQLGWTLLGDAPWQQALLNAIAVLIITCPCALALAIPVVQVVDEEPLLDPALGSGEAAAGSVVHGREHVVDQPDESVVAVGYLVGALAEHGATADPDGMGGGHAPRGP